MLWVWVIVGGIVVIGGGRLILGLLLDTAGTIDFLSELCKRPISTLLLVLGIALGCIGGLAFFLGITDSPNPAWGVAIAGLAAAAIGIFLWFKSSTWGPKIAGAFGGNRQESN